MKKILLGVVLSVLMVGLALAAYSDLGLTVTGIANTQVTISVHNATSANVSGRVRITVLLDDGTPQTLTSSNLTVDANATTSVTLTATRTIVGIGDDPQPFPPF